MCIRGPRNCVGKRKLHELVVIERADELYAANVPDHMLDFRKDFRLPGDEKKQTIQENDSVENKPITSVV